MCDMILRLDPRRPLVWRSPHTLQIGIDPLLAIVTDVTDGDARLIDALTAGASRTALGTLAAQAAVPPHRVDEVLNAVAPALARSDEAAQAAQRLPLAIVGRGVAAARVAGVLGEAGHPVSYATSASHVAGRRPAAAVLVSGYVSDPSEHQRWLRRDIAHLPVVFGESSVTIGPLVVPGATACLTCVDRHRAESDSAWSAVAAQLWHRAAPTETAALATEASIEVLRLLRSRDHDGAPGLAVRLDVDSRDRTERRWLPHPDCGCRGLTSSSAPALRRENDSAPARLATTTHVAPTTAQARAAHV